MIIRDYNKKKYVKLTEDKIIFYRAFSSSKVYDLKDIKAAFLNDMYRLRIFVNNKVVSFNLSKVSEEDKDSLKEIINRLNKEGLVCYSPYSYGVGFPWYKVLWIVICFINCVNYKNKFIFISALWMILMFFWIVITIMGYDNYNDFIYNPKEGKIKIAGGIFGKNYLHVNLEEDFEFYYDDNKTRYIFKKGKRKYVINEKVIAPYYYNTELEELKKEKLNSKSFVK